MSWREGAVESLSEGLDKQYDWRESYIIGSVSLFAAGFFGIIAILTENILPIDITLGGGPVIFLTTFVNFFLLGYVHYSLRESIDIVWAMFTGFSVSILTLTLLFASGLEYQFVAQYVFLLIFYLLMPVGSLWTFVTLLGSWHGLGE